MRTVEYGGTAYHVSDAHRAADAMPWDLDSDEFASLVAGMRRDGFDPDRPVTRQAGTGRVIDGRRRELAAAAAGITPAYRDVEWAEEQIVRWVERDLARRNITPSQRAAAAVELADLLPKGANQFTLENKGEMEGQNYPSSPRTAAELASEIGVSEKTVDAAAKVKKKAPELLPAVKEGKLAAGVAAKVADLPEKEREKVAAAPNPKKAAKKALGKKKTGPRDQPAAPDPFARPGREADPEDPPLDPRFMPNAEAAAALADKFRTWKAKLVALRTEVRKEFPDRDAPMAGRIDFGNFDATLTDLIDTLDKNVPEHACPNCCGTGDDGGPCKFCDGYGVVDRHHHAGLKARWKRNAGRLAGLAAAAEGGAA